MVFLKVLLRAACPLCTLCPSACGTEKMLRRVTYNTDRKPILPFRCFDVLSAPKNNARFHGEEGGTQKVSLQDFLSRGPLSPSACSHTFPILAYRIFEQGTIGAYSKTFSHTDIEACVQIVTHLKT